MDVDAELVAVLEDDVELVAVSDKDAELFILMFGTEYSGRLLNPSVITAVTNIIANITVSDFQKTIFSYGLIIFFLDMIIIDPLKY